MNIFKTTLMLKTIWFFILYFITAIILAVFKIFAFMPFATLLILAYVYTKKTDVKDKSKSYLSRFFIEPSVVEDKEEFEGKLNSLIEKIKDEQYSIDVPIRLNNNETAYFEMQNAEWHETRSTTKSISYGNIQQTFKLTKGLKIRVGNVKPIPHKKTEFTKIAQGDLYITNKRVFLVSPAETKKIEINNILNINLFKDGILVQRDSGKAVFIPMQEDAAMISKAILDNI